MNRSSDSIDAIAAWLGNQFGTTSASARADFDREAITFRVSLADGGAIGELEVSQEALDDHSPEAIIQDLQTHAVPQRLKADPTMRLAYTRHRDVPHLETRIVICEGKQYRFVRDSSHAVRVYDSRERVLAKMPSPLPVKPTSIFKRSLHDLCEDVRGWRGPNQ